MAGPPPEYLVQPGAAAASKASRTEPAAAAAAVDAVTGAKGLEVAVGESEDEDGIPILPPPISPYEPDLNDPVFVNDENARPWEPIIGGIPERPQEQ